VALTMFADSAADWADLVLPATSYLEQDGTMLNLEGRLQRLRSGAPAPAELRPELSWLVELADRLEVSLPVTAEEIFAELCSKQEGDVRFTAPALQAALPSRPPASPPEAPEPEPPPTIRGGPLELVRYRTLFSGPEVEAVSELAFQRPAAEVELSADDASRRSITDGAEVVVRSNGTRVTLTARINPQLVDGVARIATEHAGELSRGVEVARP
jgi:predicted molibdopterin-dependent oxidoreductase YjgC